MAKANRHSHAFYGWKAEGTPALSNEATPMTYHRSQRDAATRRNGMKKYRAAGIFARSAPRAACLSRVQRVGISCLALYAADCPRLLSRAFRGATAASRASDAVRAAPYLLPPASCCLCKRRSGRGRWKGEIGMALL